VADIPRVLTAYLTLADRCRASHNIPLVVTVVAHKSDLKPPSSSAEAHAEWEAKVQVVCMWIRQQDAERYRFTALVPLETSVTAQTPVQMRDQLLDLMTFSINSQNWVDAPHADVITLATAAADRPQGGGFC
jgi:hypothetical protein